MMNINSKTMNQNINKQQDNPKTNKSQKGDNKKNINSTNDSSNNKSNQVNDTENQVNNFEDSLKESIESQPNKSFKNNLNQLKQETTVGLKNLEINIEELCDSSDYDKDVLASLEYILSILNGDIKPEENVFKLSENNTVSDVEVVKIGENSNDRIFDFPKVNQVNLDKTLKAIGFSDSQIESQNITNQEVIQKIFDNIDGFKELFRGTLDKETINSIDSKNLLGGDELLQNIKNEINLKLNNSSEKNSDTNNPESNNKQQFNKLNQEQNIQKTDINNLQYKTISEIGKIENSDDNVESILKELYLNSTIDKNIENHFVNILRNNPETLSEIKFNSTLDLRDPVKFVKEFIENIEYMSKNDKTQMIVKVNPDQLGKMDIKYEISKERINLVIKVENDSAFKLIESTVSEIRTMIKETHNVNLENIHVDLQQSNLGSNSGSRNQNQNEDNQSRFYNADFNIKLDEEDNDKEDKRDLRKGILV